MKKFFASIAAFLSISGCGYTNSASTSPPSTAASPGVSGQVTYTQVNQQIFQPSCVSCHSTGGQAPDLSSYSGFATSTRYIAPGNPSQSLIYTITASGQMPQGRAPLSSTNQQLLGTWIQEGAPNN